MNLLQESVGEDSLQEPIESSELFYKKVAPAEKIVWLIAFTILVVARIPTILQGRFWAEEGIVFFKNGWDLPWYTALFWSHGGYLNITANFAGVLANYLVPMEKACYVTTTVALIVQMFPFVLICASNQPALQCRKYLVAAMLIVSTMPMTQEIWLSSIGSQCHLNLCVALILVLETRAGWVGWFQKALLVLAPLSGPGSFALLPFFFLRAIIDRSPARALQGCILLAASAIQLLFFWHFGTRGPLGIDLPLLLNVFFVKHLIGPILGFQESLDVTAGWDKAYVSGHLNWFPGALFSIVSFVALLWAGLRMKKAEPLWFLTAGVILATLSYCGALGDKSMLLSIAVSERYDFAPQVLFELSLLFIAFSSNGMTRFLTQSMVVWVIVIGLHEYFLTPGWFASGPVWRKEVHIWRQDPEHLLGAWPPDWSFPLSPQKRTRTK